MEKFISNIELRKLLEQATYEERLSITKVLDNSQDKPFSAEELQKEICWEGGHGVVNIFRGEGTGYLDIIDDVADELNIKSLPSYHLKVKYFDDNDLLRFDKEVALQKGIEYAEKAEEKIILKLLEIIYDKLDDDKKLKFDEELNKVAQNYNTSMTAKLTGATGLIVLGNLGGFATYTFLTTALSTISMGTLGFGAYTAATSLLSIALGPVGWAGLGLVGVFAIGKPSYEKLIPIVAMIGAIRQRIKYENEHIDKVA